MERRARETAPGETAPAPSARMGMFMTASAPELRGRENLAMFLVFRAVLYMGECNRL